MRRFVWLFTVAGCSLSGGGVQISVKENGSTAKQVHMFIGVGQPQDGSISVDQQALGSQFWYRDDHGEEDSADMVDGRANFLYHPPATSITLPIAIAVGFDAAGAVVGSAELTDINVPDHGYFTYDLPLEAATSSTVLTFDPAAGGDHSGTANRCVAHGDHLIVTRDDEDCDGFIDGSTQECSPRIYKDVQRYARPNEFTCKQPNPSGACGLGGARCTDGIGPVADAGECPSSYCAPVSTCTGPCDGSQTSCAMISRYSCTIPVTRHGTTIELCGQPMVLPESQTACSNPLIRNEQQNFLPTLFLPGSKIDVSQSNACKISFKASGTFDITDATLLADLTVPAVVSADISPDAGYLAPVVFHYALGTCGTSDLICRGDGGQGKSLGNFDVNGVCVH